MKAPGIRAMRASLLKRVWAPDIFKVWFVLSCALILAFTGGIKLASALFQTANFAQPDPLIAVFTMRQVMFAAGVLEVAVAIWLCMNRCQEGALWLILWISILFMTYRIGLQASGYRGDCQCLGLINIWWSGSSMSQSITVNFLLGYMLGGSTLSIIFRILRRGENAVMSMLDKQSIQ